MARTQTGIAFEKIRGKLADGVAYGHRGGTALRRRPEYRYPLQPSQKENNARLRKANALFNSLEGWEADRWTAYGERHPRRDPMSGVLYAPPAKNLLVGLSCKLLQIDPEADLPRLPPEGAFLANLVDVRVSSPSPSGSSWRGGRGERPETDPPSEPTGLLFTAPRPSRPGALTELMVQPLKNPRCKPGTFYKSRGFAAFPEGQPTVFLPLPPGAYAVAIQTCDPASGRTAGYTLLGKVTVE